MGKRPQRLPWFVWLDLLSVVLLMLGTAADALDRGIALGLILLLSALGWLLYRRSRRYIPPGYCQKCGYDLTGNESGRCPECGTQVAVEQHKASDG
jgi:hypothetical protein